MSSNMKKVLKLYINHYEYFKIDKEFGQFMEEITFQPHTYKHLQYFPIKALFSAPNKMVRTSLKQQQPVLIGLWSNWPI